VKTLRRHDMGFDQPPQRRQSVADGSDGVSYGGKGDRHALKRAIF
jgi:hypothetical protein